jgi:hypothetical protein
MQEQYPPPGYYPPPPPELAPRKRPVWPWVLIGLVVLMFGGCMAAVSTTADGGGTGTGNQGTPAVQYAPKGSTGIGTPLHDGRFEFTIAKVEPGLAKVGNNVLGKTAQGQFLLVYVTVKNIGDVAQHFDGSNQKLFDAQGQQFSADVEAAIYLDESRSFLTQINPGNGVDGIVVFDVPKDMRPAMIELHDSAFSRGVTVALG